MTVTIGIDLGTTNSCACFYDSFGPTLIELDNGETVLPSVVAYEDGEWLVGRAAVDRSRVDDVKVYRNIKRLVNRPVADGESLGQLVTEGPDGNAVLIGPDERTYTPAEMSSFILLHVRKAAELQLDRDVTSVVIGVPAEYEAEDKAVVETAATMAGFEEVSFIEEPVAAAYAHNITLKDKTAQRILIYDLGGGTFDNSIMDIGMGEHQKVCRGSDPNLGGVNFDSELLDYVISGHPDEESIRASGTLGRLLASAEKWKIALSDREKVRVNEGFVGLTSKGGAAHLDKFVTREELENLTQHLVDRTLELCAATLAEAKCGIKDIKHVILVGGMTKMPLVRQSVETFFGQKALKVHSPQHTVAIGAAIEGARKDGRIDNVSRSDVVTETIGIERPGGVFLPLIKRGEPYGTSVVKRLTSRKDQQSHLTISLLVGDGVNVMEPTLKQFIEHEHPLPPAAKQTPEMILEARVEEDGTLIVWGVDEKDPDTEIEIYEGALP